MKRISNKVTFQYSLSKLVEVSRESGLNLQMPGDGRYQPDVLMPYLGYDQWARWLVIVEWFWMEALARSGAIPKKDIKGNMGKADFYQVLCHITTTKQDKEEKNTKHDILALLNLMRKQLPAPLHKWLHFCGTSYDIINTAYALQAKETFGKIFWPKLKEVDELWRNRIAEYADTLQAGRTHLQTAIPITVGFWLAALHNRFVQTARRVRTLSRKIPGKFSGAVGTYASQRVLINGISAEDMLMNILGLPGSEISTQITPPEGMARFYFELVLLSGALANLGEDVRILQSSQFGELMSESSSSSAMPHKKGNPIVAENVAGMHETVKAEFQRVTGTLVSDLQRDLRGSSVMRGASAIMVYVYQQLLATERILKSMTIDKKQCGKNFAVASKFVVAELLHLALQMYGVPNTHHIVHKEVVPKAAKSSKNLYEVMVNYVGDYSGIPEDAWHRLKRSNIIPYLTSPEKYLGDAVEIARREAKNKL